MTDIVQMLHDGSHLNVGSMKTNEVFRPRLNVRCLFFLKELVKAIPSIKKKLQKIKLVSFQLG